MTINTLRKTALLEGTTLILLMLIAVPLKRLAGIPEVVSIIGPIHGIAFLFYLFALTTFSPKNPLTTLQLFLGFVAALIPFGSFVFERKVLKKLEDGS